MQYQYSNSSEINETDNTSPYPSQVPLAMTENEISLFKENIKNSKNYLEFGSGGSTFFALLNSKATIISIESSKEWINYLQEFSEISSAYESKRLYLIHADIGETQEWGIPLENNDKTLFPNYSSAIFKYLDAKQIDTILIDGRFRVACTLAALLHCLPNTRIIIHDFAIRSEYHIVLKYLEIVSLIDTLVICKIKDPIDKMEVQADYFQYQYNPE